jgi:hypothetical protein
MAQWIRRWSTEPEILGSIPSGVEIIVGLATYIFVDYIYSINFSFIRQQLISFLLDNMITFL